MRYVDHRLTQYLHVAVMADQAVPPAFAEARSFMLKSAVELERAAVAAAPAGDHTGAAGDHGGPASQRIIKALVSRAEE